MCSLNFLPIRISNDAKTYYLVIAVLSGLFSLCIILLDGVFLLITLTHKKLRTKSNTLLMLMAIPDFLTGAVILPINSVMIMYLYNDIIFCQLTFFLNLSGYALVLMSLTVVVFIAVDICVSVVTPFFYINHVTKKALLVGITLSWITIIMLTLLFTRFLHQFRTILGVIFFIFTTLMVSVAYKLVRREINRMRVRSRLSPAMQGNSIHSDRKTMTMMYLVILTCVVCYSPYVITTLYEMINGEAMFTHVYAMRATELIALTKPVWNALIHYFRLKVIRRYSIRAISFRRRTYPETST